MKLTGLHVLLTEDNGSALLCHGGRATIDPGVMFHGADFPIHHLRCATCSADVGRLPDEAVTFLAKLCTSYRSVQQPIIIRNLSRWAAPNSDTSIEIDGARIGQAGAPLPLFRGPKSNSASAPASTAPLAASTTTQENEMADYDNTNTGLLFKNRDRDNDRQPEYTGSLDVNGTKFWLSAWVKVSKKDGSKFFSIAIKEKEPRTEQGKHVAMNDEIPFAPEFR